MIKHLILLKIRNTININEDLLQWSINFLNENISSKELAEELHKLIIRKLKKRNVHSSFIDNIWDADLADIVNLMKVLDFYYVLLIFSVNTHGLFF